MQAHLTVLILIESINCDIAQFKVSKVLQEVIKGHPELSVIF